MRRWAYQLAGLSCTTRFARGVFSASPQAAAVAHKFAARSHELSPGFVVRRVLPFRLKRSVGPFVFLDHFGPTDVASAAPMNVGPHPHIGLATLTYLYEGALMHRDSTGAQRTVLPGEVNLMIAGRGVVHSERGGEVLEMIEADSAGRKLVHGLQLWLALPGAHEEDEPSFHFAKSVPSVAEGIAGVKASLVLGSAFGATSPIPTLSPGFLVDAVLEAGATLELPLAPGHEAGVYSSEGTVSVGDDSPATVEAESMAVATPSSSATSVRVSARSTARIALLGGEPFPEKRHMWWNFVSTNKERIARAASEWTAGDREAFPLVVGEDNHDMIPLPEGFKM